MSNLEHYFENLLFHDKDVDGDINKKSLSEEQIEAVETCASYVMYTLFNGRQELEDFLEGTIVTGKMQDWVNKYYK